MIDLINALPLVDELTLKDSEVVEAARSAYAELTDTQKALIPSEILAKLEAAETKITELKAEQEAEAEANSFKVDRAEALALTVETVSIDDRSKVDAALAAYAELSEAAQAKLAAEKAVLDSLLVKIEALEQVSADQEAADVVIGSINELPAVDELTLENTAAVGAARAAYEGLTDTQKSLVPSDVLAKLVAAEERIAALEADQATEAEATSYKETYAAVLALTVDTVSISNKEAVDAALAAYAGLSEAVKGKLAAEKALLGSLSAKIGELKQAAADQEAAGEVTTKIATLPSVEELTLEAKVDVVTARAAYDGLTAEQKAFVTNLNVLEAVEAKIAQLEADEATVNTVIAQISALPVVEQLTLDNFDAVEEARVAYNGLAEEQKGLVSEDILNLLISAEAKMAELAKTAPAPYLVDIGITLYDAGGTNPTPGKITKNDNGSFYITVPKNKFVDMNSATLIFNERVVLSNPDATPVPGNMYAKNITNNGLKGTISMKDAEIAVTLNVKSEDGINWTSSQSTKDLQEVGEAVVLWNKLYKSSCSKNASLMIGTAKNKYGVSNEKYDIDAIDRTEDLTIKIIPYTLERVNITYHFDQSETQNVSIGMGGKAVLPKTPIRTGYDFVGWYTDAECTQEYDFNTDVTKNIDLYAEWKKSGISNINWYTDNPNAATFYINNSKDLVGLAMLVNGDVDGMNPNSFKGKTIELLSDISLGGIKWIAIGNSPSTRFSGTFDGKNHTISNLIIENGGDSYGLFGDTSSTYIKNLRLDNVNISAGSDVGAVVGWLRGKVENCHVTDLVINAAQRTGGIVGQGEGYIERCSVTNASLKGSQKVAGIAGIFRGNISNCHSDASYTATTFGLDGAGIVGWFDSGDIFNTYYSGSGTKLVGRPNSGTITSSFYRASKSSDSGKTGIGKTIADLQKASTFLNAGWDENIWNIVDGEYPSLKLVPDEESIEVLHVLEETGAREKIEEEIINEQETELVEEVILEEREVIDNKEKIMEETDHEVDEPESPGENINNSQDETE